MGQDPKPASIDGTRRDRTSDRTLDRTLWGLTRGQRLRYGLAIAAMGIGFGFTFLAPRIVKDILDALQAGRRPATAELWRAAGLIVLVTSIGGGFQYLRGRWAAIASQSVVRRLRNRLYRHLDELPCSFHDKADTGDLVQRCTSDVETVRVFLAAQIVEIARAGLLFLVVLPYLLSIDVHMTLWAIALFPVLTLSGFIFFKRVKALFLKVDEAEGRMTTVLQENLTGIRVVRAFAREEFESEKFAKVNATHRDLNLRLIRMLGVYWGLSDVLCLTQVGLPLMIGAMRALDGTLTIGALYAFVTYVGMIVWPIRHMGRILADSGKAVVALGRLREILETPPESDPIPREHTDGDASASSAGTARTAASVASVVPDAPAVPASTTATAGTADTTSPIPASPDQIEGALEIEGLTFSFADKPILSDLTFAIQPGETVALLGPPGAGKSTLMQLLLRLYDYETGSIRLDGHELRDLPRALVRRAIGCALQEPFLYSKTLGHNVRVGRGTASHDDIVAAAQDASVHAAIEEFDKGYDTVVGERGVTLSGGQRQRVSLARAFLKDAPVLLLDDALSAVDTRTEAGIVAALRARRGRRTTIVIAHRLSTVRHADRLIVLEHGRAVQQGTHKELAGRDGPYRRLWEIQGSLEQELEGDLHAL